MYMFKGDNSKVNESYEKSSQERKLKEEEE